MSAAALATNASLPSAISHGDGCSWRSSADFIGQVIPWVFRTNRTDMAAIPLCMIRDAVATAIDNQDYSILNNVIVLTGAMTWQRFDSMPSFDMKTARRFINYTANNPLNVFAGDGIKNIIVSEGFDAHKSDDPLGFNTPVKKSSSKIQAPSTPMTKAMQNVDLPRLLSGTQYLTVSGVKDFFLAASKHYEDLIEHAKTNKEDDAEDFFKNRLKEFKSSYDTNWKGQATWTKV